MNTAFLTLQDHYAERQALPSIDPSQDWFLVNGEEEVDTPFCSSPGTGPHVMTETKTSW